MGSSLSQNEMKQLAAKKAVQFLSNQMIVGLGTGSTASFFIEELIIACKKGLQITAVSSSKSSLKKAEEGNIPIEDINNVSHIDVTVDGADEIDDQNRMIKGGGGAHVREKILASSSRSMIVIIDETKVVKQLGKRKLPVEIVFFGFLATQRKIENIGFKGIWRKDPSGDFFITENGNLILDIQLPSPSINPEEIHQQLINIPGVVDTGFFFNLATKVIIGCSNGSVKIRD